MIIAKAPGKLMLAGSYGVVHGRASVVTAVDQCLQVRLQKINSAKLELVAPDLGLENYQKDLSKLGEGDLPKAANFIETGLKIFYSKYPFIGGLKITTKADFSSNFGFGSSSAVTVALMKALNQLFKLNLTNKKLFDLCYKTVIEVQGVGSGFDLAAGIWEGTIKYVSPAKVVEPLKVRQLPIVVGYTKVKADTASMVKKINQKLAENPKKINLIFDKIGQIAEEMATQINLADWVRVGELLNQHQVLMRQSDVSSEKLENLISASLKGGALGAGLSGAGGGDCMLAVINKQNKAQVERAIISAGGQVMKVNLNYESNL